jgi:hypothetical protein
MFWTGMVGLAQDRYRWRALVNTVMNLRVHKMLGIYRVTAQLVASRVVLSSTELVIGTGTPNTPARSLASQLSTLPLAPIYIELNELGQCRKSFRKWPSIVFPLHVS